MYRFSTLRLEYIKIRSSKSRDLTGLFCAGGDERLSTGRNGKGAEEDIHAGAGSREAAAVRGADRTRPDGSAGVPRGGESGQVTEVHINDGILTRKALPCPTRFS